MRVCIHKHERALSDGVGFGFGIEVIRVQVVLRPVQRFADHFLLVQVVDALGEMISADHARQGRLLFAQRPSQKQLV